jgi:hypothetical protein
VAAFLVFIEAAVVTMNDDGKWMRDLLWIKQAGVKKLAERKKAKCRHFHR